MQTLMLSERQSVELCDNIGKMLINELDALSSTKSATNRECLRQQT